MGALSFAQEIMMKPVSMLVLSLCTALGLAAPSAAQMMGREPMPMQDGEGIYGSELMTMQERNEYQRRMHAAKTEQEREQIRLEHHEKKQERAKTQGKTLPEMPPPDRGPGMGPGGGGGMGPGGRGGYGY